MIFNIIDRRKQRYRWKLITAIIEPTFQDNSVADSDETEEPTGEYQPYDSLSETSLADAIAWAQAKSFAVTLYFYDLGQGI
jgi:hypothetical protein